MSSGEGGEDRDRQAEAWRTARVWALPKFTQKPWRKLSG